MATDDTTTRPASDPPEAPADRPLDFIRQIVADDLASGKHDHVATRFPPEPNGYLHIGHAKSICVNFGIARDAREGWLGGDGAKESQGREALGLGRCHLRFDDTNPMKEDREYIEAIKRDVQWLGFDWGDHQYHASDYFDQLYDWAVLLIKAGRAYVDDQSADAIREGRGTLTAPGSESPHRNRSADENLALFQRMKGGEFPDGAKVLRAKIDMSSPNVNLRDPVMYRILHATHPHAGDKWCIYPMYDWAHGQSDWIEGITHSLCTLEFEAHRPLYDWFVQAIIDAGGAPQGVKHRPRQIEFARLNLTHTVMSKRKLLLLVNERHVAGWDDPRMPTISGMRRRGYPPAALRDFCDAVGNSKRPQTIELSRLEHHVREHLNKSAPRVMGVLDPLKVVITNYPDGEVDYLEAVNNPEDESAGTRQVPFCRELWIEREDFMQDPPKKFFRLGPGREVRLRWGYFITCNDFKQDADGHVTELHCTYDPETRGGQAPDGRKVKGTIHWVSAGHALEANVHLYDTLFAKENAEEADEGKDWRANLNPDSLVTLTGCKVEPSLAAAEPGVAYQFERKGYFVRDEASGRGGADSPLVFNRTVGLRDSWAKVQGKGGASEG